MLIALLVLFVPMFFSGSPPTSGSDQTVSLAIPPAPDRDLQTRTMSLDPNAPAASGSASGVAAPATSTSTATGNQLATVNIGSGASPSQPLIPQQPIDGVPKQLGGPPTPKAVAPKPTPVAPTPKPVAPVPSPPVKTPPRPTPTPTRDATPAARPASTGMTVAGQGNYTINLSAYASAAGAASLQHRVRALGYPVTGYAITQAGQSRTLVIAGPFATRTAAEAARLRITQSIPGVPARLQQDVSHGSSTPVTASPVAASKRRPGGWAVQLAAVSSRADANALRNKLRANGFDGYVDSVHSGGKLLWRVRAGPQTRRADAQRVHDQIKARMGINGNVVSVP